MTLDFLGATGYTTCLKPAVDALHDDGLCVTNMSEELRAEVALSLKSDAVCGVGCVCPNSEID